MAEFILETRYRSRRIIHQKYELSVFFSTFHMDQLGKIRRNHFEERLKISKTAKFKSYTS